MASLEGCKSELRSIIAELKSIQNGIDSKFSGVGEDKCRRGLQNVIDNNTAALQALERCKENGFKKGLDAASEALSNAFGG